VILVGSSLSMSSIFAQTDGSWISTASGTQLWATPTNWSSDPVIPGGSGSQIVIEANISSAATIDLQSTDRTVGILSMGDASGASTYELSGSGGGDLIFERVGGAQFVVNQGGINRVSAGVTLNSNLSVANNNSGQNVEFTGVVGGVGGITQNGVGRVYFSQSNTFAGGYTLNSGTAAILNAAGFGSGLVTLNGGSLENAAGQKTVTNSINLGGHVTRTGVANVLTLSGTVTLTGNSQLTTNERLDLSGNVTGGFSLVKDGAGILNFYGAAKTYSGGFVLDDGEVLAQVNSAFGTGTLRLNGGTLSGGSNARLFANKLELAGDITLGSSLFTSSLMTFSGSTTLVSDSTLHVATTGGVTLSGAISGSGNLVKTGAESLTLNGVNSHTGYTEVQAGTLRLRGGSAIADASEVRVSGGTLDLLVDPNETVGSVVMSSGAITVTGGGVSLTASSFHFTNSGTVSAQLAGGSAILTKEGLGTVLLDRENGNTYGGGTVVNAGTLLVNNSTGSGTGSGSVSVASGAALAGDGIIAGATTISGSLRPGNSIGMLTVSNDVTWNGGDAWVFELGTAAGSLVLAESGGSSQDQLSITGAGSDFLSGSGDSWVFDFAGGGEEGWYHLITWSGSTTFNITDFQATNLAGGLQGAFSFDDASSGLYLQVSAIPEPSSLVLLLSFLSVVALRRHRR